jgi:hypothetical protein
MGFATKQLEKQKKTTPARKSPTKKGQSALRKRAAQEKAKSLRDSNSTKNVDEEKLRSEVQQIEKAKLAQEKESQRLLAKAAKDSETKQLKIDGLLAKLEDSNSANSLLKTDLSNKVSAGEGLEVMALSKIKPHPVNETIYRMGVDDKFLDSIVNNGLLDPIVVCEGKRGDVRILSGHRRYSALTREDVQVRVEEITGSQITEVKVINLGKIDDDEQLLRLVEYNRQREKVWSERMMEAVSLIDAYGRGARIRQYAGGKSLDLPDVIKAMEKDKKSGRETKEIVAQELFGFTKNTLGKHLDVMDYCKREMGEDDWRDHTYAQTLDIEGIKKLSSIWKEINGDGPGEERIDADVTKDQGHRFLVDNDLLIDHSKYSVDKQKMLYRGLSDYLKSLKVDIKRGRKAKAKLS